MTVKARWLAAVRRLPPVDSVCPPTPSKTSVAGSGYTTPEFLFKDRLGLSVPCYLVNFFFLLLGFLYPVMHFRLNTSVFQSITALILHV